MFHPDKPIDANLVLPIVVGAHLRAEVGDRSRANQVKEAITSWMRNNDINDPPWPLVCSDLWYLNDVTLKVQPTICIGHPEINAATAALAATLQTVANVDDSYRIQLDPEYIECTCCLWGVDDIHAEQATEAFIADFLPSLLGSIFGLCIEK
jgi:hypothetical protein